jgi:hypothetical protein
MSRIVFAAGLVCFATVASSAQTTYPYIAELKQNYTLVKNNLLKLAEKMPEEHYSFKPVPETRAFSESIAHVADSQARSCGMVNGTTTTVDAAAKKSKADLVAALKASFAMCDTAFDAMTETSIGQMVRLGQYGYMAVYLRLKGIVPPSTENM